MCQVKTKCPEFPGLCDQGLTSSELLEKLQEEMKADLDEDKSPLKATLEELKCLPTDLDAAYMALPKIMDLHKEVKDGIDGSAFSGFGSKNALRGLHKELTDCCKKELSNAEMGVIKDCFGKYFGKLGEQCDSGEEQSQGADSGFSPCPKEKELKDDRDEAKNKQMEMLSCLKFAKRQMIEKKNAFCEEAGSLYIENGKEAKLACCETKEQTSPPAGRVAKIRWLSTELVRLFQAAGVTDERGKKSHIPCDTFTVSKKEMYAYSLKIEYVLYQVDEEENLPSEGEISYKGTLDDKWKEWLEAIYCYYKFYKEESDRAKKVEKFDGDYNDFLATREKKYLRCSQGE